MRSIFKPGRFLLVIAVAGVAEKQNFFQDNHDYGNCILKSYKLIRSKLRNRAIFDEMPR